MFYDPTFILVLPALLLALYAQVKVKSTFARYLQERSYVGLTGAQVARQILNANGLHNVSVERVGGELTDHYDPRSETVRLSPQVYDGTSVAAVGVAAHEVGHAVQHARGYVPLGLRTSLFPVAAVGSQMAFPLFMLGFLFSMDVLMLVGIWFFIAALAFQLITLPVEFNASRRALAALQSGGYLTQAEVPKAKAVLSAAALTYVAAVAVAASQLIRLLFLRGQRRR
ncbi:MAG: zinc metallopeptidase [Limnochordia bacterium]|jgi:Zn-dependent membrane protease YugP|nr:zinc metallopeptidase [Limnochordia bacterium]MDI9464819.1 zinc metallopeptidase [Bacillota bacterium]NLO95235.1 zinc metallopeptidase [Bacillota bacterium]HAI52302.1 peptidase [Bacillota bacterium]HAN95199.1 peptidase [Bacillota bacterium]